MTDQREETESRAANWRGELLLYGMEIQGKMLNVTFAIDFNWALIALTTR